MTENLYEILGVDEKAEIEVINAAHKALAKKYHPDTFAGNKKVAEEKLKRINSAYDVLSDPKKRKEYDKKIQQESTSPNFDDDEGFGGDEFGESVLKEDWSVVIEVYPEAEFVRKKLYVYSPKLSFTFQILILSSKSAEHSIKIGEDLKKEFLTKFFGTNRKLQVFVEKLLFSEKRHIASEINKKILILGSDASERVMADVMKKYDNELRNIKSGSWENFEDISNRKKNSFDEGLRRHKDAEKRAAGEKAKRDFYQKTNNNKKSSSSNYDSENASSHQGKPLGPGFFVLTLLLIIMLSIIASAQF